MAPVHTVCQMLQVRGGEAAMHVAAHELMMLRGPPPHLTAWTTGVAAPPLPAAWTTGVEAVPSAMPAGGHGEGARASHPRGPAFQEWARHGSLCYRPAGVRPALLSHPCSLMQYRPSLLRYSPPPPRRCPSPLRRRPSPLRCRLSPLRYCPSPPKRYSPSPLRCCRAGRPSPC